MNSTFRVLFQKNENILTVRPEGRLDSETSPSCSEQIGQELDGIDNIVMDLEQVDYISSAGLRLLLEYSREVEKRGGGMKLINVNDKIMNVLELTGFLDFVTVE